MLRWAIVSPDDRRTEGQEKPLFSFRLKGSFLSVLVLIQVLLVTLSVLFTLVIVDTLKKRDQEKTETIIKYVESRVDHISGRAALAALAVTEIRRVAGALAIGDRPQLLELCQGLWKHFKARDIVQFNFARPTPAGMVEFLRIHKPEVYGDITTRGTMVKCNEERALFHGLEQGKAGWGFRAVAPISHEGRYVGCVELGLDFGEKVLAEFNENFEGRWSLINLQRGVSSIQVDRPVLAAFNQTEEEALTKSLAIPPEAIARIRAGKPYSATDPKTERVAVYVPVRDFKGDVALYVRVGYRTDYFSKLRRMIAISAGICLLGLLLSSLIILVLYREVTVPIAGLVEETEKIKRFDLEEKVVVKARLREIQAMVSAVASMKTGLASFKKYVPAQLVRQLMDAGEQANISGHHRVVTIFFSDIADFTTISESLRPNELTARLSEYLSAVTEVIMAEGGIVDKYIGDAVMAFWGAPLEMKDHPLRACEAALKARRSIAELNAKWTAQGKSVFHTRMGVHTGEVIVGNMGSEQRLNYTVIGDSVNLASRLEGLNKNYKTNIIISQETYELCKEGVEARILDFVVVKGRTEATMIYELAAMKGDISATDKEFLRRFTAAVEAYRARKWDDAIRQFKALAERKPEDAPARMFIARCEKFKQTPPPEGWDGLDVHARRKEDRAAG